MTELPKGWKRTEMGEIGRYLNGKAFKSQDWKSTGRPIIRIQNLTGSGTEFNYYQGEVEDRYVVQPGDLLFSWSATLGTYIWNGPEAVLNQHIFKVESNIDKKFHRYLLDFKIQEMQSQTHGSGMVHITKKSFDAIEVNIPPIEEQRKIVELLEDHLSRLDAALADVKQAKIKAIQFRRSLFKAAFTGNLNLDETRIKSKFPGEWEIKRLDEIADIIMGQSPPGSSYNETGQGKPFFQGKAEFGDVHPTVRKYTTAGTKFAKAGDILMSVRAPVGPTNLADIDCVIGRGLAAIRAKSVLSQSYLRWVLKHLELDIQSKGTGTTFDAITGETLRSTLVAVPPIDEQHKIVELLEDHLSRLEASVNLAVAMEKQSIGLRRSLLQAAFTGQLTKEVESV